MAVFDATLLGLEVSSDAVTVNLPSTVTIDDEGKALTIDSSAANQMKLAGDGDPIHGWLEKVEVRKIEGTVLGTVYTRGWFKFPVGESDTTTYGDYIVGAGSGLVKKKAGTGTPAVVAPNGCYVVDKGDGYVVARIVA